jgi:putative ABC transport system permease protein
LAASLALADLRHDAAMMGSLIIAIGAVVTPLLLILGLKYGLVETQRQRLLQDPTYREIRPSVVREFDPEFFVELRARPDVAAVIPSILHGASTIRAELGGVITALDLQPTIQGDPLLTENGAVVPGDGEAVLSQTAAERLRATVGQTITLTAARRLRGRNETVATPMRVVAVLEPRGDLLDRVYVPLGFAEDVETWRLGAEVPARGWSGTLPLPYPSFDTILLATAQPLSAADVARMQIGTGVTAVEPASADALSAYPLSGQPAEGLSLYRLRAVGGSLLPDSLVAIANQTRAISGIVLPTVEGVTARLSLTGQPDSAVSVVGMSLADDEAARLGLAAPPWGRETAAERYETIGRILLPGGSMAAVGDMAILRLALGKIALDLPVRVEGTTAGPMAVVPAELIGILRTAVDRRVVLDKNHNVPVLDRPGYRGFRLYAKSIEAVQPLYRDFIVRELEVTAQLADIQRVQALDRGLTRLFWLVAAVGIVGGVACLAASLHGAVQRKRRDYGMLRLLGFTKLQLLVVPLVQAVTVALLAFVLALVAFFVFAALINAVFAADLPVGKRLCWLPASYLLAAGGLTIALAAITAVHASVAVTRIDPAEAIRVE